MLFLYHSVLPSSMNLAPLLKPHFLAICALNVLLSPLSSGTVSLSPLCCNPPVIWLLSVFGPLCPQSSFEPAELQVIFVLSSLCAPFLPPFWNGDLVEVGKEKKVGQLLRRSSAPWHERNLHEKKFPDSSLPLRKLCNHLKTRS